MTRGTRQKNPAGACPRGAAASEQRKHFRSLVDHMQEGIAILQIHPLHIVFANKSLAKMGGYSVHELTALNPKDTARRIHPADRATVLGYMRRRLDGRAAPTIYPCRIVRRDVSIRHVEISSRKITYGGAPAVQATFIDRTPSMDTERRLWLLSQVV